MAYEGSIDDEFFIDLKSTILLRSNVIKVTFVIRICINRIQTFYRYVFQYPEFVYYNFVYHYTQLISLYLGI